MNKTSNPTPASNPLTPAAGSAVPVFLATLSVAVFTALCSPVAQARSTATATGNSAVFPFSLLHPGSF